MTLLEWTGLLPAILNSGTVHDGELTAQARNGNDWLMGLERNGAALLLKMRSDGVRLDRLVTLGRQNIHLELDEYCQILKRIGKPPVAVVPEYADDLLEALGARQVEAMDFSAYEGATLLHDLNEPIPPQWRQQFDMVFDGGTLEHVFNFPAAIKNCMQMLKPRGHFVSVTMPNNWCGHGFYQFSPELFFRVFSPPNGFSIVEIYIAHINGRCFAVKDPALVQSRVELCNNKPVLLLVHAQRDSVHNIFAQTPQQSDYLVAWTTRPSRPLGFLPQAWKNVPVIKQLRRLRRYFLARQQRRACSLANRKFYSPVDLSI